MSDEIEIAWLAGLLEGEGSFIGATDKYPVCLSLEMTDRDVVERLETESGQIVLLQSLGYRSGWSMLFTKEGDVSLTGW